MNFVVECNDDLVQKCRTVSVFSQKTVSVVSIDDLLSQLNNVVKPAVGILYEGAKEVVGDGPKQMGTSGEIVFTILMLTETSVLSSKVDVVKPTHDLLDTIRSAIHGTRSPTGHFWRWKLEAPAAQKGALQVWAQRWSCPVQLPPTR